MTGDGLMSDHSQCKGMVGVLLRGQCQFEGMVADWPTKGDCQCEWLEGDWLMEDHCFERMVVTG